MKQRPKRKDKKNRAELVVLMELLKAFKQAEH